MVLLARYEAVTMVVPGRTSYPVVVIARPTFGNAKRA